MNQQTKQHIIFLCRWYPHRYDPMFGLFVQRHAEAEALYNDVTAIYVHADTAATKKYEICRTEENGVDTIRVYYRKRDKISSIWRFWHSCQMALRLAGPANRIHVHVLTRMGVVAWWEKKKHHTPYLITEHWSRYLPGNDYHGWLRKKMTKLVVRDAEVVTTVTENLATAMKAHGLNNERYVVLPNVVDTDLFQPTEHHHEVPRIIHISCFEDKSKNISGLLESLRLVANQGCDYEAVLIGEGMDYEAMKQKAHEMSLDDKVRFTGLLQGKALVDELASGDFLVLSSNYENMPVVILEALSCGLPIVSTHVGGISEMVNDSNGILVPARNIEALANAITTMCETYSQYDKDTLRNPIIEKYGKESVGKFLREISK